MRSYLSWNFVSDSRIELIWWHQYLHPENWHPTSGNAKGVAKANTTHNALQHWEADKPPRRYCWAARDSGAFEVHPKGWLPRCWPLDPPKKWLKYYCKWSSKVNKALPSGCCSWKIEGKVFFLARSPAASGWVWDIFTCNYQAGACKISDLDQGNSLWIGFSQAYHFQSKLLQKSPSSSGGPPSSNLLVM